MRQIFGQSKPDDMQSLNPAVLRQTIQKGSCQNLGLYIHIPFCRVRCRFCAFYVEVYKEQKVKDYLSALKSEIIIYADQVGLSDIPILTIYIGGGTPTILSSSLIVDLLDFIKERFQVDYNAEVTVEAHPSTVTFESIQSLRNGGFNRISLGVQSFNESELIHLGGRTFRSAAAVTMEEVHQAGFDNVSLDLMYGFPSQTFNSWRCTLETSVALMPNHLSCYVFTVEEGTHFHREVTEGFIKETDEDLQNIFSEITNEYLRDAGLIRYEISNFSYPGYACRHNLRYWQGDAYLGLGPSAQSYVGGVRFGNVENLESYCRELACGKLPFDSLEMLTADQVGRERIIFGLRMTSGVKITDINQCISTNIEWCQNVKKMKEQDLLIEQGGYLKFTEKGFRFADMVAMALL